MESQSRRREKPHGLLSTFRIYDTKIVAYDNVERDLLLLILTGDLPLSIEWLTRKTIISLIRLQL